MENSRNAFVKSIISKILGPNSATSVKGTFVSNFSFENTDISDVFIRINSWEKSLNYLLVFNPGAFFMAINRVVARVAVDSSKIPSVTNNDEIDGNNDDSDDANDDDDDDDDDDDFDSDDGFYLSDDEDYDPDEEMDENEIENLADTANDYNGIQNEDNGSEINGIEEHEYDEILFVLPNQEFNNEYNQASNIVFNQIILDQGDSDDLMENNQIDMENVDISFDV